MTITQSLEHLTKTYLPAPMARVAKRLAVYPRYQAQQQSCRQGYEDYGQRYQHPILFIAGLPKSGTTWLERMISSYPGYHDLLIPDVAAYELAQGGSHNYDLPTDIFNRFNRMLVLTKMHVYGSHHNVTVLCQARIKHVVLYRDLRDVAVSYYYYVKQTPWHPEYKTYASLSLTDGLAYFGQTLLPEYAEWVRLWHANRDRELSMELRYEDMLAGPIDALTHVARHFGLDYSLETIKTIVDTHSFRQLSGGRQQGVDSKNSFYRKGVAGDWKNHFSETLKELYKRQVKDFFVEFGYEQDCNW